MTTPDDMLSLAREMMARAYAPYSGFHVGAALLLRNGDVVTGANVENASYGLTLCAETAAVAKIANEGWIGELAEVAIVGGRPDGDDLIGSDPVNPCGRCRQLLWEHGGADLLVDSVSGIRPMSEVLPDAFGPDDLRDRS